MNIRRFLAAFTLGVIVGAAGVTMLTAAQLESATVQRDLFRSIATDQRQQMQQLRQQLQEFQTRPAIETVKIHLSGLPDGKTETVQIELTERLRSVSDGMVGQMIDDIDPDMAKSLYHNREITHQDSRYLLRVETVVIAPTTHFFIDVSLQDDKQSR